MQTPGGCRRARRRRFGPFDCLCHGGWVPPQKKRCAQKGSRAACRPGAAKAQKTVAILFREATVGKRQDPPREKNSAGRGGLSAPNTAAPAGSLLLFPVKDQYAGQHEKREDRHRKQAAAQARLLGPGGGKTARDQTGQPGAHRAAQIAG